MSTFSHTAVRVTALAVLLGSTGLATASFAAPAMITNPGPAAIVLAQADDNEAMTSETTTTTKKTKVSKDKEMHHKSPEEIKAMVLERITTLHDKLLITPDQEKAWGEVAEAMRDSESNTSKLIMERHKNAGTQNAMEDLESYQAIAQSHADGLKNVISSFSSLYDGMSDEQKKNADSVFDHFEGREHGKMMKKK